MENKMYGWYSAHMDRNFGHAVYLSPEGLEIKITEVLNSPDKRPSGKWNDYVYVGEVTTFIKGNDVELIDKSLPIEVQSRQLMDLAMSMIATQNSCQEQFSRTGKCFCHTCPVTTNTN